MIRLGRFWLFVILLLGAATPLPMPNANAQSGDDWPLPNGHFYRQAAPPSYVKCHRQREVRAISQGRAMQ
ncbi:MAG: hypothetical protein H6637_02090 [Ardenticatenales bacterium]|nr:hypothetical protein [Ardenticatenales bacterium]